LKFLDCLASVGDCCIEKAADSTLWAVETTDDAREVSWLAPRNILEATLAPELLDPFSLGVLSSAFALPLRSMTGEVFEDMDLVSRAGILSGAILLRLGVFFC
jgi:hypothetical protein